MPKLLPGVTVYVGRKKYRGNIPDGLNVPPGLIDNSDEEYNYLGLDETEEIFCEKPTIIPVPPKQSRKKR